MHQYVLNFSQKFSSYITLGPIFSSLISPQRNILNTFVLLIYLKVMLTFSAKHAIFHFTMTPLIQYVVCILYIEISARYIYIYIDIHIYTSRGAAAQSVTVKPTGCGFDLHSRRWNIYLNLYFHFFALVSRQSATLSSAEKNSAESGTECFSTRFPLPTLLRAGYSVKLIKKYLSVKNMYLYNNIHKFWQKHTHTLNRLKWQPRLHSLITSCSLVEEIRFPHQSPSGSVSLLASEIPPSSRRW